jgi:glyoxylase-like metal-dependent hydrolase (beta-lactamase superfamily II)
MLTCIPMLHAVSLLGNSQRLDGGAMFGNVPRAVWSRWYTPDDLGRIPLSCRALLLDHGDKKVLCETGIGAFFEPKLKDRFGVVESEHVLLDSLAARGLDTAEIDFVILSHLHFDHAGGLLSKWSSERPLELLFPKALYVVGKTAYERAKHPHPRDRASFIPELLPLLEASGRLEILETPEAGTRLLGPEYSFVETNGHTPGMLHTWVRGRKASLFFCADLVPGTAWVHLPVTMGYDRYPERLIDEKAELFPKLEAERSFVFFTHDPSVAAGRIQRDASGRYGVSDSLAALGESEPWELD